MITQRNRLVTDNDLDLSVDGEKMDVAPLDMPVSRAYYKLAQVFDDDTLLKVMAAQQQPSDDKSSATSMRTTMFSHGNGMDIGASPGGWTQVLYNTLHIPTIIALDPAMLAERVMKLPGVHHIFVPIFHLTNAYKFCQNMLPIQLLCVMLPRVMLMNYLSR